MNVTIGGFFLAIALTTVGCAQAFARHDAFERVDSRMERAVETARRTCQQQQQPEQTLPSTAEYERCVLAELRSPELAAAKR